MNILPMTKDPSGFPVGAPEPAANLAGIDAIRAFAAIAVVVLHALVPYLKHPMPGLVWSVADSTSSLADGIFWAIELFVMPLFLVIAGMLTFQSWQRRSSATSGKSCGAGNLIRGRAKRLLRPLVFAVVIILPIDLYIWVLGWVADGIVSPVKLKSLKFDESLSQNLWGLSHLWFLHYLFSYVVLFAGCMVVGRKIAESGKAGLKRFSSSPTSVVVVCWCIAVSVIYFRPEVIWGFQHAFAPVPSKWTYNGCFFVIGLAIANFDPTTMRLRSISPTWSVLAACLLAVTVPLGIWSLEPNSEVSRASSVTLAVMTATSSLTVSVAMVSLALRWFDRARMERLPRSIQYVAAASFWIYLIHHPILSLIHIDLKWMLPSVFPIVKAMIATVMATVVSLISYEYFIRCSRLGAWLGMNWTPQLDSLAAEQHPKPILSISPEPANVPVRRAA
jgi:peptidoglycan/LPS O-acetylase OafA/YrhL